MRRLTVFALSILMILAFASCDLVRALEIAQQTATRTEQLLAKAEQAAAAAEVAVEQARTLAEASGSEKAMEAVASAERALFEARAAIPPLRAAAEDANNAVAAARVAAERGDNAWGVIGLLITTLLPSLGANFQQWRTNRQTKMALVLAADHGDRMEKAETDADADRVKEASLAQQRAAGVDGMIAKARGKI